MSGGDALELARALNTWEPRGVSIELASADRAGLVEQLADHLVDVLELTGDVAERFVAIATSPYVADLVDDDAEGSS